MSKIKWSWKLRIKKNSSKIHRLEEVNRDLKDRLENLEIKFENLEQSFRMRGEGLEAWYDKYVPIIKKLKERESE